MVYDLWAANKVKYEFEDDFTPVALCYAPDARTLAIATAANELLFYDTRDYKLQQKLSLPFTARKLAISGNNYFVAASDGKTLGVWNLQTQELRKSIEADEQVNSFAFSADDNMLAVLTSDGKLATYDTRTFFILQTYEAMGIGRSCYFHPDGKYIAVVTGENRTSVPKID